MTSRFLATTHVRIAEAMARTRAQDKAGASEEKRAAPPAKNLKSKTGKKRQEPEDDVVPVEEPKGGEAAEEGEPADEPPPAKKSKQEGDRDVAKEAGSEAKTDNTKIKKLLDTYGAFPLVDSGLSEHMKPTAETMFAHLLNAMLSTTRISHQIAAKTVQTVIKAGYANLENLEKSSWQQRTEVLTEGGYTRYREKTATQLGELAEWLRGKYDGDVNNLLKAAKEEASAGEEVREGVRKRLQEVKGIGNVALDVFCDTAQGLWTELAPFVDPRSDKTAGMIGMPTDVQDLYEAVGKDPVEMCKLACALTTVRLDKREKQFA